jgi:lipopolysaccharide/colanic/teichoic acid biosynthesis glycosyltransferase
MFVEQETTAAERDFRLDTRHAANGQPLGPPHQTWHARCKTLLETGLTICLLFPAALLIVTAGLFVKLTSRGPVFYLQKRVGRKGKPYTIYKIRTMYHDCERFTGPRWATVRDPRITPVGRWLRRLHIDELPQLWNVLRGEMNLVGPRPERPEIAQHLKRLIPRYEERWAMPPGVTGLAQVQLPPDSDLADVRTKLAYDLYYVQHLSLSLDLRILLCTGCYLLGMPFSWTNRLLKLPSGAKVEEAYEGTLAVAQAFQPDGHAPRERNGASPSGWKA